MLAANARRQPLPRRIHAAAINYADTKLGSTCSPEHDKSVSPWLQFSIWFYASWSKAEHSS